MKLQQSDLDRRQIIIQLDDLPSIEIKGNVYHYVPVPDYDGFYATTCGFVISTKYRKPRVLKPQSSGTRPNYLHITLGNKTHILHRVIACSHLYASSVPCPDGQPRNQVNHVDGNTRNNKVANLEIVSRRENMNFNKVLKAAKAERDAIDAETVSTTFVIAQPTED